LEFALLVEDWGKEAKMMMGREKEALATTKSLACPQMTPHCSGEIRFFLAECAVTQSQACCLLQTLLVVV
jgi:hypothetical protein